MVRSGSGGSLQAAAAADWEITGDTRRDLEAEMWMISRIFRYSSNISKAITQNRYKVLYFGISIEFVYRIL